MHLDIDEHTNSTFVLLAFFSSISFPHVSCHPGMLGLIITLQAQVHVLPVLLELLAICAVILTQ